MPPRRERVHMIAMLTATRLRPRSQYCQARYTACSPSISHTHPTLSRLVYLHVRCRVCLPAGHIYLPVRRFLHHLTLHPTLQPAQDPPTAAVPILYSHCRSCPLKLLHFRPAIAYRHSASPLGTTHVVLDGRTTQCPPHTNYLTTARSHAEIVSSLVRLPHTQSPTIPQLPPPSPTLFPKVAPSRGLSPVRSSLHSATTNRMPSPRSSPALRPVSPLSPRYEPSRFETLQPPSPRAMHSRHGNGSRRANTHSLKLPSLPRFHPANYPSTHSSMQSTPDEGGANPPVSPRAHQRMYSDAQKHLLMYQQQSVAARTVGENKPVSPRLAPLGSPGPVTPLELEQKEGYLLAGASQSGTAAPADLVERLIREESRRNNARSSQANNGPRSVS
jgi:hypothetical protein